MTAQDRGWGPPPTPRSSIRPARAAMSGAEFPGGLRASLLDLAETLLAATEARGYRCVVGWCWGHAPRKVRGSQTTWSNHSWGLALDINAPANPMSSRLVTDMPSWMPRMWEDCGFRWGGRYRTRPDAMHYEYLGGPGDVLGHLARARGYLIPEVPEEDDVIEYGDRSDSVTRLQWRINELLHGEPDPRGQGKPHGLVVDGFFGDDTLAYVHEVQKRLNDRKYPGRVSAALLLHLHDKTSHR